VGLCIHGDGPDKGKYSGHMCDDCDARCTGSATLTPEGKLVETLPEGWREWYEPNHAPYKFKLSHLCLRCYNQRLDRMPPPVLCSGQGLDERKYGPNSIARS
jgi:hypothetical protein